ncbi:MAG: hypothetical protein RL168_188, partial [Bacteroidota bacterium]
MSEKDLLPGEELTSAGNSTPETPEVPTEASAEATVESAVPEPAPEEATAVEAP